MLTSIKQVHEEFFKQFFRLKIPFKSGPQEVHTRYARKSSYDYSEEQDNQIYPCIVIQDYTPELKEDWFIDMRQYFGGLSSDGLKGYLYRKPVWMTFKYDVSIVSKSYLEFIAMQDYFLQHFVYGTGFIFDKKFAGDETVGDVVLYKIRETDIPRTDGLYEKNYEFTLFPWVYPQTPVEVETIQEIVIGLTRYAPERDTDFMTEDNKIIVTADEQEFSSVYIHKSKLTADEVEAILEKAVLSEDVDEIKTVDEFDVKEEHDPRTLYVVKEE